MKSTLSSASVLALGIALALAGCSGSHSRAATSEATATATATMTAMPSADSTAAILANGRSIFQTGKDLAGVQIVARKAPMYPTCAACHHANGSGSKHLPGGAVSADLRHAALASGSHPYTVALLERAISTGVDNEGKPLDPVMPRWNLSKSDLHAVAEYVSTLK